MAIGTSTSARLGRSQSTRSIASSHLIDLAPASAPVLVEASGALTQVCGSLVEPEARRQQWACSDCGYIFPRDATIYAAPARALAAAAPLQSTASSSLNRQAARLEATLAKPEQQHFCKACYTARYSMGPCMACGQAVLGSTKEDGTFVKAGIDGHLWHGRCWSCTGCGKTKNISLGLDGHPVCENCFDKPRLRKHVVPPPAAASQLSGSKHGTRPVSTSALSGSASRKKMGATIAELSRRLGHEPGKASQAAQSGEQSSAKGRSRCSSGEGSSDGRLSRSSSRNGGTAGRARPLTAQFSGNGFNLAAFQSTTAPSLSRSDSRSRISSPTKAHHDDKPPPRKRCARCHRSVGLDDATTEADIEIVTLKNGGVHYHAACFCCSICNERIDAANRQTFIRLEDERVAHPACAPPATVERSFMAAPDFDSSLGNISTSSFDHVTHQREPRPSVRLEQAKQRQQLPPSYLTGPGSKTSPLAAKDDSTDWSPVQLAKDALEANASNIGSSSRRFQSTAGAAPPTRSTLMQRPTPNQAKQHAIASLAVGGRVAPTAATPGTSTSTSTAPTNAPVGRLGRLGGMQMCGGCGLTVSSLESVPGPRGQRWHRKCLVCSAPCKPPPSSTSWRLGKAQKDICGKALDSSAKVTEAGEVRCRACYDSERARHPVATQ